MKKIPSPFDLGVLSFDTYQAVIDARSPREYAVDHVPGATNLPVLNDDQYAEIGTMHRGSPNDAYARGVQYTLYNMAEQLPQVTDRCPPGSQLLVYCFRGGKRSKLWADNLRTVGYDVTVLPGGWKAYRRWVVASLETMPRLFDFRVLRGQTGCGKTRVLHALESMGEQTLDLEQLASHRGSLIGSIPGTPQPTQKWFDSQLLDRLRGFDLTKCVWVEGESKKIGNVQIPGSLHDMLQHAPCVEIHASMATRCDIWSADFPHFLTAPEELLTKLSYLKPLLGGKVIAEWQALADQGDYRSLFASIMRMHYDPAYANSDAAVERAVIRVEIQDASAGSAERAARELCQFNGRTNKQEDD